MDIFYGVDKDDKKNDNSNKKSLHPFSGGPDGLFNNRQLHKQDHGPTWALWKSISGPNALFNAPYSQAICSHALLAEPRRVIFFHRRRGRSGLTMGALHVAIASGRSLMTVWTECKCGGLGQARAS